MFFKGILHEEDITSFNLPFYATCTEELEAIIGSEGSFSLDRFETSEVNWDIREEDEIMESGESSGKFIAKTIRAITESMLASHFGDTFIDEIFERCALLVAEHLSRVKTDNLFNIVVSLIKK